MKNNEYVDNSQNHKIHPCGQSAPDAPWQLSLISSDPSS